MPQIEKDSRIPAEPEKQANRQRGRHQEVQRSMAPEWVTSQRRRRATLRRSAWNEGNRRCRRYRRGRCERSVRRHARRSRHERRGVLRSGVQWARNDGCGRPHRVGRSHDGDEGRPEGCHNWVHEGSYKRCDSGRNRRRSNPNRRTQGLREYLWDGLQSGRSGGQALSNLWDNCSHGRLHNRRYGLSERGHGGGDRRDR
jgi:hypothetical protein